MRTKIALLSAALVAAGVASSMAQSNVYSLNVVGYVNLTVTPGYNLISLPLQSADVTSSINSTLTNTAPVVTPGGSAVYTWDSVHSHFNQPVYAGGDGNWYDAAGINLVTNALPPGSAFFLQMPTVAQQNLLGDSPTVSNLTVTVVGTVLQGTNTFPVTPGYGFYGNFEPVAGDITTNGFPVTDNSELFTWSNPGGYSQPVYGLGTDDSSPDLQGNPGTYPLFVNAAGTAIVPIVPAVGAGFLYQSATNASVAWTQTFTVH